MSHPRLTQAAVAALCALGAAPAAPTEAASTSLSIKAVAEVEIHVLQAGRETVKLAPATRVVPGDQVVYTLEIRNASAAAVAAPQITYAVPVHMAYLADSATGPGAEVSYSTDGGHVFDRPENLRVRLSDGQAHSARPADYTHIRWNLKNPLKPRSAAFARFRAVVK
jgi:uncharacterized repeat protein (TIGR01451 family)